MKRPSLTLALLAGILCRENNGFRVRLVDELGKMHHYSLFLLTGRDVGEYEAFQASRKRAALDENGTILFKISKDSIQSFDNVGGCQ